MNDVVESISLASTTHYTVLERLHEILLPSLYFEIGSAAGRSLMAAQCSTVAVDPRFLIKHDIIGAKPSIFLVQQTSDAFFESPIAAKLLTPQVDLAFLDGLHLFEYLLRDFINTERYCSSDSLIGLHDCLPCDPYITVRNPNDPLMKKSSRPNWWAGDVWKLVPILRTYRPDLSLTILDATPTGLVLVENLDPMSSVLSENYDEILREYAGVDLISYDFSRYINDIDITPVEAGLAGIAARRAN